MLISARTGLGPGLVIVNTTHVLMNIDFRNVRVDVTIATTRPTDSTHRVITRTSTIIVRAVVTATIAVSPAERKIRS